MTDRPRTPTPLGAPFVRTAVALRDSLAVRARLIDAARDAFRRGDTNRGHDLVLTALEHVQNNDERLLALHAEVVELTAHVRRALALAEYRTARPSTESYVQGAPGAGAARDREVDVRVVADLARAVRGVEARPPPIVVPTSTEDDDG